MLKIKDLSISKYYITSLTLLLTASLVFAQAPVARFTVSATEGCSPFTVILKNTSTVTGSATYVWELGNGQFQTTKDASVTFPYSEGGTNTHEIKLRVRDANGVNTTSQTVTVRPSPSVNFTVSQNVGCTPTAIQFNSTATVPDGGSISNYLWDFGDGTTSTEANPQHVYTNVGYFTVVLTVTTSNGCSATFSRNRVVRMIGSVAPNFIFKQGAICQTPVEVNFTNQTAGAGNMTYQWSLGNGTSSSATNPSTNYAAYGTYNVKLVAISSYGCRDSITKPVVLTENITSFSAPASICPGAGVVFKNTGTTPISSFWDFGDGTSARSNAPTKSYSVPGTYTVTLTNQYANCTGTAIKTVVVAPPPPLNFRVQNDSGCATPHTVQFSDTTSGSSNWFWNFGDGTTSSEKNPSHTYTTAGNYNVTLTLTTAGGCTSTVTKPDAAVVRESPSVSITTNAPGGCVPFTLTPAANVSTLGTVTSYQWNFGDGTTATGANPSHTYTAVGNYLLRVTITTNKGCVVAYAYPDTIKVGTPPNVDFTTASTNVCAGDPTQFQSLATPADAWNWDFGDGVTSIAENPSHQFEDVGPMTIRLTALNNGCGVTVTKTDYINARGPVARFSADPNCADPRIVSFANTSITDPAIPATNYTWNFGDGTTFTGASPGTHTYSSLGTQMVSLVADNGNCSYSYSFMLDLFQLQPQLQSNKSTGIWCRNEPIRLSATNIKAGRAKSYQWRFDGQPAGRGTANFDTTLATNGTHNVLLTVTDIYGCTSTASYTLNVDGAVVDFNVVNNGGCRNATIGINTTATPANSISSWTFNFGDGTTETFNTNGPFSHVYTSVGNYNIQLTAIDNIAGCKLTVNKAAAAAITYPVANFTAEDSLYCQGTVVQFVNNTSGINMGYIWDFGDGTQSTAQDPSHTYNGPDSAYTVSLVAIDPNGCRDTLVKTNMIRIVAPRFTLDATDTSAICPPLLTQFNAITQNVESVHWDFGDGGTSSLPSTGNFYDDYGTYTATLEVTGYHGCVFSSQQVVHLYNPQISASLDYGGPLEACNTITANFKITIPPNTSFNLYFGDGTTDSSQNLQVTHVYDRPGLYRPRILVIDSLNCRVTVTGKQDILVNGIYPDFNVSKKQHCDTGTVVFTDYSLDGLDSIVSHNWNMGDGTTLSGTEVTHHFSQPGLYLVTESMTTSAGCSNTVTDTVRVFRTPHPVITGPTDICLGALAQYHASTLVADSLTYWRWTMENHDTSNQTVILRNFPAAGLHTLQLYAQNKLGCGRDTTVQVNVHALPKIIHEPQVSTPVGIPVTLPVTYSSGVVSYSWTPGTDLSCTDCPQPLASPLFNTTYKVEVIDSLQCRASSSIIVKTVCNEQNYFIPNTFSPNGDGQNDVFYPRGTQLNRIQSMRIFNRWGEMVFEKKNFNPNAKYEGWDGRVKGIPVQMDTYVYIIEVICENAQIIALKGNVTLIR